MIKILTSTRRNPDVTKPFAAQASISTFIYFLRIKLYMYIYVYAEHTPLMYSSYLLISLLATVMA